MSALFSPPIRHRLSALERRLDQLYRSRRALAELRSTATFTATKIETE